MGTGASKSVRWVTEDGGAYYGDLIDGKPHGKGRIVWPDGDEYEGDLEFGQRHGHGTQRQKDGKVYEGNWSHDLQEGRGTCVEPSGSFYEGEWHRGLFHGRGYYKDPNGAQYDGEWHIGKPHGRGRIQYPDGRIYDGEWREGLFHGRGLIVETNGSSYEGQWQEGVPNTRGIYYYADGSIYDGQHKFGVPHGRAVLQHADGFIYDGVFQDGKMEGRGVMTSGSFSRYEGSWKDSERHGFGVLTFLKDASDMCWANSDDFRGIENGTRFEGNWYRGKKHGHGCLYWKNSVYLQTFYNDELTESTLVKGTPKVTANASFDASTLGDSTNSFHMPMVTTQLPLEGSTSPRSPASNGSDLRRSWPTNVATAAVKLSKKGTRKSAEKKSASRSSGERLQETLQLSPRDRREQAAGSDHGGIPPGFSDVWNRAQNIIDTWDSGKDTLAAKGVRDEIQSHERMQNIEYERQIAQNNARTMQSAQSSIQQGGSTGSLPQPSLEFPTLPSATMFGQQKFALGSPEKKPTKKGGKKKKTKKKLKPAALAARALT